MASANEQRTVMVDAFKQEATPTLFLASHASNTIRESANLFELDIVRGSRKVAVDIAPGAGGNANSADIFTNKEYSPPFYDEYVAVTAEQLRKRMPGHTKYDMANMSYGAQADAYIVSKWVAMQDKIVRAEELQARDAFFAGKITLADGTTVDFKKKSTHDITPTYKWSHASGDPVADIEDGCNLIRTDGMIGTGTFELILSGDSLNGFLNNAAVKDRADFRRVDLIAIQSPRINTAGAAFHGVFSAGSYNVELWTYPEVYENSGGTTVDYITTGRGLLLPKTGLRIDKYYGGIPQVVTQIDPRTNMMVRSLSVEKADYMPYTMVDEQALCLKAGVRSSPLFVPHQVDGFVTYTALV